MGWPLQNIVKNLDHVLITSVNSLHDVFENERDMEVYCERIKWKNISNTAEFGTTMSSIITTNFRCVFLSLKVLRQACCVKKLYLYVSYVHGFHTIGKFNESSFQWLTNSIFLTYQLSLISLEYVTS